MTVKTVPTFEATIYAGFRDRETGEIANREAVCAAIQAYVDAVGLCVSVRNNQYIYTHGEEPGVSVGLINYPRFPSSPEPIKAHALAIAEMLLKCCKQMKVTVVMPDVTVMLSNGS